MKRNYIKVKLTKGETRDLVDAKILEGISDENIGDYKENWVPLLKSAKERYKVERQRGGDAPRVEDAHWDWSKKVSLTRSSLSYRHFVVECENRVQGLMQLELAMHRSRIEDGQHLVYVDFISVAPWNRRVLSNVPYFQGIGSILIVQSIGLSLEEGFMGRIGLHSLPGAADWYKKLGMISLGQDRAYQNLEYFEMRKEESVQFIKQMNK